MRGALTELVHRPKPVPAAVDPYRPQAPDDIDATVAEVKRLWWFHDGSIMNVGVRHHLWASWGSCPRHTWLYAISEVELRGGGLLGTAAVRGPAWQGCGRGPRPTAAASSPCGRPAVAGQLLHLRLHRAHGGAGTTLRRSHRPGERAVAGAADARPAAGTVWRPRACPACLGGDGIPCRPHLLAGAIDPPRDLDRRLGALRVRTAKFLRSQTWRPPSLTPLERIAWLEALGFFAGWAVPDVLTKSSPSESAHHAVRRHLCHYSGITT